MDYELEAKAVSEDFRIVSILRSYDSPFGITTKRIATLLGGASIRSITQAMVRLKKSGKVQRVTHTPPARWRLSIPSQNSTAKRKGVKLCEKRF
ncbi:unnamed protein product [marine sediment metagenome]|uniref:Uncharacterized protein n=1 Tax=marine sediment metagenome TaxID=412755 RepID=X1UV69_9ZZZZ